MNRAESLRLRYTADWERMVTHPFLMQLANGSLPRSTFTDYMTQDRLFIDALVRLVAVGIARAPSLHTVKPLGEFLQTLMGAEEDLFVEVFSELGISPSRPITPLPVTKRFIKFLGNLARRGTFAQIAVALHVTEGTYADWANRLLISGALPDDRLYRRWINIHADPNLADLARYLGEQTGQPDGTPDDERIALVFSRTLRYEIAFWEAFLPGRGS